MHAFDLRKSTDVSKCKPTKITFEDFRHITPRFEPRFRLWTRTTLVLFAQKHVVKTTMV